MLQQYSDDQLAIGAEVFHAQQDGALGFGMLQHVVIDIPLATIIAQTTGVAFNIGAALPTNCRLVDYNVNVLTALSGGGMTAVTCQVQGGTDAAGALLGGAAFSVFTGALAINAQIGSNPYPSRSGQQLKMTLTNDGTHALSALTAGHLSVDLFYFNAP